MYTKVPRNTCTWKFLVPATARTHVHGSSSYQLLPMIYTCTWKFLVPATAHDIHMHMEVPRTSYCPYTCTRKLLVPATARTHVHGSSSYQLLPVHTYTEVPRTSYCPYTRVLARPFPKGTVPFGDSNVPFGSAPKPTMCPLAPPQNQLILAAT